MRERAGHGRAPGPTLAVLAKAPIPGYAKTRLAPRLGADGAAEVHAVLLERTLRTAATSGFASVAVWCAPDRHAAPFRALRSRTGFGFRDQPAGDLGARMRAAFEDHLPGGGPVVMIGTDAPELTAVHLRSAIAALERGADAVILPAEDGGFAAIGLVEIHPSLFEGVEWGKDEVLAATRERMRRLGWRAHELAPVRDVDRPEDLEWLLSSGLLSEEELARIAPYLRASAGGAPAPVGVDIGTGRR